LIHSPPFRVLRAWNSLSGMNVWFT
jgi:hypothetical protein